MNLFYWLYFVCLSGYFSLIFIGISIFVISSYLLFLKNFKLIKKIILATLSGFILVQLMYLNYWQEIIKGENRAGEVYQKMNIEYFLSNAMKVIVLIYKFLITYTIYPLPIIIILSIIIIFLRKRIISLSLTAASKRMSLMPKVFWAGSFSLAGSILK